MIDHVVVQAEAKDFDNLYVHTIGDREKAEVFQFVEPAAFRQVSTEPRDQAGSQRAELWPSTR